MYVDTTATALTIEPQCEYFVGYGNYFLLPIVCKETQLIITLKTIFFLAFFVFILKTTIHFNSQAQKVIDMKQVAKALEIAINFLL